MRSPQSDVRVGWSTKTTLVNDKGHPTTSKKNELLGWDGWPLLSLLERAMCACRETKTKFLCRTKLTGALGAILAQAPRAPERWFSFSSPTHPEVTSAKPTK